MGEGASLAPPGATSRSVTTSPSPPHAAEAPPADEPSALPRMRGYVLPMAELRGISAATPVGSALEIWVTWRRDVGGSQVQRVVGHAVLGAVRQPSVPEGPETVEIFIPVEDFPDFLAAHEFGSLNAAIVP